MYNKPILPEGTGFMTPQGWLTASITLLSIAITMTFFYVTIAKTPKHGFFCAKCGKELPANAPRCNSCGTEVANADQFL